MRALLALVLLAAACSNPKVKEGKAAYVYHKPLVFGQMEYRQTMIGPKSTGLGWRLYTIEVDVTEAPYEEEFTIITRDNLQIELSVRTRIKIRTTAADRDYIRELVEEWGGPDWYEWRVKAPLRSTIRSVVMRYRVREIQPSLDEIGSKIRQQLETRYKNTPIEIRGVEMANFKLPDEVQKLTNEIKAEQQRLEKQQSLLTKTKQKAAIRYIEARNTSEQQRIIGKTLDPLFVQREAVKVYERLAKSSNATVIVLPNQSQGTALPSILPSGSQTKTISPKEREYLKSLDAKYEKLINGEDAKKAADGKGPEKKSASDTDAGTKTATPPPANQPAADKPDASAPDENLD